MTIILVILAALILLAVLFLIIRVNKVRDSISSTMMDYYKGLGDHYINLGSDLNKQLNDIITAVDNTRTDVVRLANKVDEGLTHCGNQTRDLKEKFGNLETRLTAPIDKINDVHNRVKTLNTVVPDKAYVDILHDSAVKTILDKLCESPDKVYFTALGEQIVKEIIYNITQSQSKPQPISAPETEAVTKSKKQTSKTKKTEIKN